MNSALNILAAARLVYRSPAMVGGVTLLVDRPALDRAMGNPARHVARQVPVGNLCEK